MSIKAQIDYEPERYPIILIRGLIRESRHWGNFADVLQKQVYPRPVYCIDLPGNGQLNQQHSPASIAQIRRECQKEVKKQTDKAKRIDVIAISMGGMIALDWASIAPLKIISIVLINSSIKGHSSFYQRLNWRQYGLIARGLFANKDAVQRIIYALTSNGGHQSNQQHIINEWLTFARENPVSRGNFIRQLWAALHFKMTKKPINKILVICSKNDRLVNCQCSYQLASNWSLPLIEHESAGHDLPLDDPNWLIEKISQWYNTDYPDIIGPN